MKEYTFFIGSDNKTHRVSEEHLNRIKKILNSELDAFTIYEGKGVWKKTEEDSIIVEVISNEDIKNKIKAIAQRLKKELKQEAIFIVEQEVNAYLI